ncbi:MAG: hypothetical protein MZV65_39830 [Chromatiales bacterium]|nr:hypothetical protein [Chromatiales bacterium]
MVLLVNSDAVLAPDAARAARTCAGRGPWQPAWPRRSSSRGPSRASSRSAGIAYSTASGRMRHEGFGGRTDDLCEGPARAADAVSGCVMLIRTAGLRARLACSTSATSTRSRTSSSACARAAPASPACSCPRRSRTTRGTGRSAPPLPRASTTPPETTCCWRSRALPLTGLRALRAGRGNRRAQSGVCAAGASVPALAPSARSLLAC